MTSAVSQEDGPKVTTSASTERKAELARALKLKRAVVRKRGLKTKPKSRTMSYANDVELGSYGSKWRHGWIPLNPTATAIKAKKFGKGGTRSLGKPSAKVRLRSSSLPSGPGRTKGRGAPSASKPSAISTPGVDHSKSTYPQLVDATARGDHLARAEKYRRDMAAYDGTSLAKVKVAKAVQASRLSPSAQVKAANAELHSPTGTQRSTSRAVLGLPKEKTARLRITETKYRGHTGHTVGGTDSQGRHPKVFTPNGKADAVQIKANLLAGKNPFAHYSQGGGQANASNFAKAGANLADALKEGDKARALQRDRQLAMLPGTREHLGHKYLVKKLGENPQVPSGTHGVEHSNGATVGYIRPGEKGGLRIGSNLGSNTLPEHEVKNVKEAIAGLHASWTIHGKAIADKKAAEVSARKASNAEWTARRDATDAAKAAAQREQAKKEAKIWRARHEAQSRKILNTAKGPRARVTVKDTATMQKVRAAQAEQLSRSATNLHTQSAENLQPGQAVSFRIENGVTRDGYVVHANGNKGDPVHLSSINPATGKGETHTILPGQRGSLHSSAITHNAAANKALFEGKVEHVKIGRGSGTYPSGRVKMADHFEAGSVKEAQKIGISTLRSRLVSAKEALNADHAMSTTYDVKLLRVRRIERMMALLGYGS